MSHMFRGIETENDFPQIVSTAYSETIRQYHSFVLRTAFRVSSSTSVNCSYDLVTVLVIVLTISAWYSTYNTNTI